MRAADGPCAGATFVVWALAAASAVYLGPASSPAGPPRATRAGGGTHARLRRRSGGRRPPAGASPHSRRRRPRRQRWPAASRCGRGGEPRRQRRRADRGRRQAAAGRSGSAPRWTKALVLQSVEARARHRSAPAPAVRRAVTLNCRARLQPLLNPHPAAAPNAPALRRSGLPQAPQEQPVDRVGGLLDERDSPACRGRP